MEIVTCPHCQMRVVLMAGQCPSCRTNVASATVQVEEKPRSPPRDVTIFAEPDLVSAESTGVSENPYRSPRFTEGETRQIGLLWILFSFQGRIPRRYFWGAAIGAAVGYSAFVFVWGGITQDVEPLFWIGIMGAYALLLWSNLAAAVKRLHDRDVSGYFVLIALLPLLGAVMLLVETGFLPGSRGANRFGPELR
jgi:uncharacterized membrane protein YhaH (DUF805 family)